MNIENGEIIERNGKRYRVDIVPDQHHGAPWDESDGHGVVSEWTRRRKRPGERILCGDRGSYRYYDVEATTKIAKRDGWRIGDGADGAQAARAVEADFARLRAWCAGDWFWVGVVVTELCTCSHGHRHDGESASLWGIESDAGEYLADVANDLISELNAS